MIWKIWFYISVLFLFAINIFDFLSLSNVKLDSEWNYIFGLILFISFALLSGILYGLGWKKKIFSIKMISLIKKFFLLALGCFFVPPLIEEYHNLINTPDLLPIFVFINMVFVCLLLFLFVLPFILLAFISLHKYKKYSEKFCEIGKPYLKFVTCAFLISFLSNFAGVVILKFNHLSVYNFWDYLSLGFLIYQSVFLIGYAFNKKILNKLFWRISGFIYVPCYVASYFLTSDIYKNDTLIWQTSSLWSFNILSIVFFIFFVYILYNYSFDNKIFKSGN